jgi:hypothetical protein
VSIALAVSVITLATAVVGLVTVLRKVQAVHVLVNSQLSSVLGRVDQLTRALTNAGVDVPRSLPVPPGPVPGPPAP